MFSYHSRIVGLVSGLRGSNGTSVFSDLYTDSCLIYAFASLVHHHHCLELSQPSEFRIGASSSYPLASSFFPYRSNYDAYRAFIGAFETAAFHSLTNGGGRVK